MCIFSMISAANSRYGPSIVSSPTGKPHPASAAIALKRPRADFIVVMVGIVPLCGANETSEKGRFAWRSQIRRSTSNGSCTAETPGDDALPISARRRNVRLGNVQGRVFSQTSWQSWWKARQRVSEFENDVRGRRHCTRKPVLCCGRKLPALLDHDASRIVQSRLSTRRHNCTLAHIPICFDGEPDANGPLLLQTDRHVWIVICCDKVRGDRNGWNKRHLGMRRCGKKTYAREQKHRAHLPPLTANHEPAYHGQHGHELGVWPSSKFGAKCLTSGLG